ncbi:iron complex transport system permease protein [Caldalkalibacillus uzonensis]|uniref:Iron complex transport system permease protein n=1 Tax=Caldalkalibacillus uzonensis TaxID=353224 RepID=A0ABU0CPN4_9BACI|nr:iron chelate uptake ABC transporter family permease subunit [Caldalkalibacillus uzonensis]MDQ0338380.1 iron complex transport system permease protein [Caldalkalibacillus uzonensis]
MLQLWLPYPVVGSMAETMGNTDQNKKITLATGFNRPLFQRDQTQRFKLVVGLALLGLTFVVSLTVAVMIGPVSVPPLTVWQIILANLPWIGGAVTADWSTPHGHIVWDIRLPRVLLAGLVGAGLATVGVAIQALVRNSLADPYILGVSSGASVGATAVIVAGAFSLLGQYALALAAFGGALLSVMLVFVIAQIGGRISIVRLLLAGIAISMVLSSLTSFIVMTAPREEAIRSALFWMMGSLAGARWEYLTIPVLVIAAGLFYLLIQFRTLNALLMGDEAATTLGVDVHRFRKILIMVTALITGVLVAVSGAIGFVGLMIPHMVRLVVGADHRLVLPFSALAGAIFLIWADVFARMILAPEELPIGIVTALCGGPFFIWLLRSRQYSFGGSEQG